MKHDRWLNVLAAALIVAALVFLGMLVVGLTRTLTAPPPEPPRFTPTTWGPP